MMELFFYACLAVFIMVRLYNTLGSEDCSDDMTEVDDKNVSNNKHKAIDVISNMPLINKDDYSNVDVGDMIKFYQIEKLIKSNVEGFLICKFLKKAEYAFEIVLKNLYECNLENLKPLLTTKMYNKVSEKIYNMQKRNDIVYSHNIVSIQECKLENLEIDYEAKKIKALLYFKSEQVNYISNKSNPDNKQQDMYTTILDDRWVFVRDIDSKDFRWFLDEIIAE